MALSLPSIGQGQMLQAWAWGRVGVSVKRPGWDLKPGFRSVSAPEVLQSQSGLWQSACPSLPLTDGETESQGEVDCW